MIPYRGGKNTIIRKENRLVVAKSRVGGGNDYKGVALENFSGAITVP